MADKARLQIKETNDPEKWGDVGLNDEGLAVPVDIEADGYLDTALLAIYAAILDTATEANQTNGTQQSKVKEVAPTDSTKNNPSYELDYTADELTQLDMTVGTTVYRRTLTWTSNNLTAMTEWSEV